METTKDNVLKVLQNVVHPAQGKDIVSLGLVKDLSVDKNKISFELSFPAINDPVKSSLKKACEISLKEKLGEGTDITIEVSTQMHTIRNKQGQNKTTEIKNIIAIASGKGGVGKSTVASNLAITFAKAGKKTGIIDADIFGPSIPKMMGAEGLKPGVKKVNGKDMLVPIERHGLKMLSIGFFVDPADATVWRGPMASNALKQLIMDADWGELDYLFVDLPPGTSDIHLTLVQTLPVTGAVIVSTPQDVALADAIKGIKMFKTDNIKVPVLGLIENMAWFTPDELPENKYYIFGKNGCQRLALEQNLPLLGQVPIYMGVRESGDSGEPISLSDNKEAEAFKTIADNLFLQVAKRNSDMDPTETTKITRHRFSDIKN